LDSIIIMSIYLLVYYVFCYRNVLKKTRRYLNRAQEIIDLTYGPWNEVYREIAAKKEILSSILKNFNV